MNLGHFAESKLGYKQDDSASAGAARFHVLRLSESATGTSTCI